HGRRSRPTAGWAALTDTQQTVARLLAEGLSNPDIAGRMFISRRTVQFPVSNILGKLSLSSRGELASLVARRGGQPNLASEPVFRAAPRRSIGCMATSKAKLTYYNQRFWDKEHGK